MHCKKGGIGDYDVCFYSYDICTCRCEGCEEAYQQEKIQMFKNEVARLDPDTVEWYKTEIIREYLEKQEKKD